jgi:hypothetical protein
MAIVGLRGYSPEVEKIAKIWKGIDVYKCSTPDDSNHSLNEYDYIASINDYDESVDMFTSWETHSSKHMIKYFISILLDIEPLDDDSIIYVPQISKDNKISYSHLYYETENVLCNWLGNDFFINKFFKTYKKYIDRKFVDGNYSNICQRCGKQFWNCDKYQMVCQHCCNEGVYPDWIITDAINCEVRKRIKEYGGILIDVVQKNKDTIIIGNILSQSIDDIFDIKSDYIINTKMDFEKLVDEVKRIRDENNM